VDAPDPAQTLADLRRERPDLVASYVEALPGARAAVLGRLWGAFAREPIPGITARETSSGRLTVRIGGHTVTGPATAAEPYAPAPAGLALALDGGERTDPAALLRALDLPGEKTRLAVELDNSVANLALARAAGQARPAPTTPTDAEQSVVDGHPLHPCCRARIGMSTAEVLRYAPEHRPIVGLHLMRVPADRWFGDGPPLLVVHPWQREHVLDAYPFLTPVGWQPARPLMSLRTLAPVGGTHHVKTAVDVQMTSAVRTVSAAAVRNGPAVSALLAALAPPGLDIMREDRAGAVLVDGEPSRSLAYVRRQAPRLAPGETAAPLAALAVHPIEAEHFPDLVRVFLPPLLSLLARGVALEAHGQNTLVVLRDGRPVRLLYRDVGGVRISPARLRAHGVDPPPLHGDLATDEEGELRAKLLAAAVGGALAEQVAALSRAHDLDPAVLWDQVAATTTDPVLFGDTLPVKATTAMRLASDPLTDVWATLPNPLAGLR
jgi:staphyloferrin A synthase